MNIYDGKQIEHQNLVIKQTLEWKKEKTSVTPKFQSQKEEMQILV